MNSDAYSIVLVITFCRLGFLLFRIYIRLQAEKCKCLYTGIITWALHIHSCGICSLSIVTPQSLVWS